jgi:hypothetical protein
MVEDLFSIALGKGRPAWLACDLGVRDTLSDTTVDEVFR